MNGLLGGLERELLLILPPTRDVASRPAIRGEDGCDYAELWARASSTAGHLTSLGVGVGDRVAVWLPKGSACISSILGVLRSGACYVPADATHPPTRVEAIFVDAEPKVIITTPHLAGSLGARWAANVVEPCGADAQRLVTPEPELRPEDLAAILYTSGSTGYPKGVRLTHRNISSFIRWCLRTFTPTCEDRFAAHASVAFDLSTHDIFVALAAGAAMLPIPDQLRADPLATEALLRRWHPTIWYSVPSALDILVSRTEFPREGGSSLRSILFAGEVYAPERLRELALRLPGEVVLGNLYGPTETNVCIAAVSNAGDVLQRSGQLFLGKPVDGVRVEIMDESGEQVSKTGLVGEIVITGACVSPGYWGQPDRPVLDAAGRRSYATGDLGEYDERGDIIFRGRADRQIQAGGHRVELAEVEEAVSSTPGVLDAAVEAIDIGGRTLLVAAIVGVGGRPVPALGLKRHCAGLLPRHMIPQRVWNLERLPRNSNGKIDHQGVVAVLSELGGLVR